jgi:hypothetical protein
MIAIKIKLSGISGDIASATRDCRICTLCVCVYVFVLLPVQTYDA